MNSFVRRLSANPGGSKDGFCIIVGKGQAVGLARTQRYIATCNKLPNPLENLTKNYQSTCGLTTMNFNNTAAQRPAIELSSRTLTTEQNRFGSLTGADDERREFLAIFPEILNDCTDYVGAHNPPECAARFSRALNYITPRGKLVRGLSTIAAYKSLVNPQNMSNENRRLANILGWCVEMVSASIIFCDDVIDNGTTRRGQICWHKLDDVGLTAVNDAFMMENGAYIVLRKYFGNMKCYVDLMEILQKASFLTVCGQTLDLLCEKSSVTTFTMEKFNTITNNKTSFYSFYLPYAIAAHFAGMKDPEVFRETQRVALEIGNLFQVQNDFFDCFSNQHLRIGTDIQDNKVTWFAVTCMQLANAEQKQILADCYGSKDKEKVNKVKELYKSLDIPKIYAAYEEETYNTIKAHIEQMSCDKSHGYFLWTLNKIYKRTM